MKVRPLKLPHLCHEFASICDPLSVNVPSVCVSTWTGPYQPVNNRTIRFLSRRRGRWRLDAACVPLFMTLYYPTIPQRMKHFDTSRMEAPEEQLPHPTGSFIKAADVSNQNVTALWTLINVALGVNKSNIIFWRTPAESTILTILLNQGFLTIPVTQIRYCHSCHVLPKVNS